MAKLSHRISLLFTLTVATFAHAQTQPAAVAVPFVTAAAGFGTSTTTPVCAAGIPSTDGSSFGDGCPATQARLASPQGAAVDTLGNLYFADYNNKQVRVVYNAGTQLAAAITAANSGYAISSTRSAPAPTPVAGNVYTIAGVGANTTTFTAFTATGNPCANYAASGQPTGLNTLGDGCPGASAPVAARDVKVDTDGNLFLADYSNGRVRVLCVNCATGTLAQKLITLENPTVTAPANGAIYTVAGVTSGYRDAAPGYGTGAVNTGNFALLRLPTGVAISSSDDIFIADNTNNAVRVLYNGGSVAKAMLAAQGTAAPVQGYVYTLAGAGCVSAATGKTGSVSTANACLTTAGNDTPTLGNAVGSGPVWTVFLDTNSNLFYTDATNNRIKVLYGGIANPLTLTGTLSTGYTYTFAGLGTGVAGTQNAVAPSALTLSSAQSIGGDLGGNLFFFDYGNSLLYGVSSLTGIAVQIGGNSAAATSAAGTACNGLTGGPAATDAFYDGCPATQAKLASPRGPIVADTSGNLFFGDSVGYLVRRFSYASLFPNTAVAATSPAQNVAFTFPNALTLASVNFTPGDFLDGGSSTCSALSAQVAGSTCVASVRFKPSAAALREGAVTITSTAGTLGTQVVSGLGTGAALALDPATATTLGSGYNVSAVSTDSNGNVYITDTTTKSALRLTGSTATTLLTGLNNPQGIAVDGAGNVFIADAGANSIVELPVIGGTKFTLSTAVSNPHSLAVGPDGTLFVADTGNNRIAAFAPNSSIARTLAFTGLTAPLGVAVSSSGTVFAAPTSGNILALTSAGVQTTRLTSTNASSLAVDAAGNLYLNVSTNVTEAPAASANSSFAAYTGTTAIRALALDSAGNLFLADSGATGVVKLARTSGFYKFNASPGSTAIHLSSIGTDPVASTAYSTTNTTDFAVAPSTTGGCSGALASGSTCTLTANFTQVSTGVPTDVLTFAATTNGAATFTLTAASAAPAITVTAAPTSTTYGNTVTLKATVYGSGNTSGTVNFYLGGTKLTTVAVDATATASYTYTPAVGTYTVTADYTPTGATAASVTTTAPATFTVTQATPSIALSISPTTGFATSTYTASVTVSSTAGTPGGTVTVLLGANTLATITLDSTGKGSATFTNLPAGTNCITARYNATTNFASVTSPCTNVTVVTQVTPTVALTVTPTTGYPTTQFTATATVTASVGTPAGTVTFFSNTSTQLGTATLNAAGVATLSFTNLAVGTDCITAVYTATTNYTAATSTCANVTVAAGFSVTAAATTLRFPSATYQQAQTQLTVATGGRTDTLTFACAGLPSKLQCAFSPASVTLAGGNANLSIQMLVANSGAKYAALDRTPLGDRLNARTLSLATLPVLGALLFAARRRKRLALTLMLAFAALAGSTTLTGCSGQDSTTLQQGSGSYNFTVNVNSGSTTLQSLPFTVVVP